MRKIIVSFLLLAALAGAWAQDAKTASGFGRLDSATGPQNIAAEPNKSLASSKIRYFSPVQRDSVAAAPGTATAAPIQETADPFTITDMSPQGELPKEMMKPTISVVFSQPVVPLAKLGDVITSSPLMRITPPLKGVYRWYGTRMFAFESSEMPTPMTEYTVTIDPAVKSLGGKKLTGETSFKFHFDSLRLVSLVVGEGMARRGDIPPAEARTVTLHFSYPVDLGSIDDFIDARSETNARFPFTVSRPPASAGLSVDDTRRSVTLSFRSTLPEDTKVSVIVRQGALASKGAFPTEQEQQLAFQTLRAFTFGGANRYSWDFQPRGTGGDSNPVYLVFSHPVKKESILGKITIDPPIPVTAANIETWNTTVKLNNLPFEFDTTYTFTLDRSIQDVYGRRLPAAVRFEVKIGNPFRYAWFPNEGIRMLEAQFPKKYVWESQDLLEGSWAIDTVDDPYTFRFSDDRFQPLDLSRIAPHTKHFETVDLTRFLNPGGKGWVGAWWKLQDRRERQKQPTTHWISLQVTDLGLTVRYGSNKVVCLVSRLSDGKVVPGARVTLTDTRNDVRSATTDPRGIAIFTFRPGELLDGFYGFFSGGRDYKRLRVRVESGDDKILFEPNATHNAWHNGVWLASIERVESTSPQVFMFSDRRLYKPGETITFRGIDRSLTLGTYSSYKGGYTLRLRNTGTEDEPLVLTGTTTSSGGFHGTIALPDTAKPGDYVLEYSREGQENRILQREPITVSFFRRLLFTASLAKPDLTYFVGDTLSFRLKAEYLSGGNVNGASYDGYWTREPSYFQPEGARWNAYAFGPAMAGWDEPYRTTLSQVRGAVSAAGEVEIKQVTTKEGVIGQAYAYRLQVNVTDTASSQMVGVSKGVLVHSSAFYIGGKLSPGSRYYAAVEKNSKVDLDVVLVRPDGSQFTTKGGQPVDVDVRLVEWKVAQQQAVGDEVNTRYERVLTKAGGATLDAADGTARWSYVPTKTGQYVITLRSTDADGRQAVTTLSMYATGSEWIRWYSEGAEDITLIPDKPLYSAGDTAKIMMQSPAPAGTYLVTIEREGIQEERIVELTGSTQVIEVPVKEEYLPVIYVAVSSWTVRQGPPTHTFSTKDLDKPKGLFGVTPIRVESKTRRIDLEVAPAKDTYRPGNEAEFVIRAKNRGASLAGAEITFMVVDRGVVDLVDYHVPDPLAFFYAPNKFPLAVRGADSRSLLIDPVTYEVKDLHGGDAGDSKVEERKDFNPTAYFQPYLVTNGGGEVRVRFKLPDSLTTYRCTAVAVKDNLLGISESDLKVQNPINVRAYLPRRMRPRDTATSGVIVTNLDGAPQRVTIQCASNILTVDGGDSRSLTVQPGTTIEVPFTLAAEKAGTGEIVFTLTSALLKERLRESFVVEQPSLFETVATIGKVVSAQPEKGAVGKLLDKALGRNQARPADFAEEGIRIPSDTPEGKGTLRVTLDSTRVSTLGRAFSWLFHYPYGCLEQRSSRLLPLVAFGPYIASFGVDTEVVNVRDTVEKELAYIASCQLPDGGFPLWPNESVPWYYVSLRIAHIYALAKETGYRLPRMNLDGLFSYLDTHAKDYADSEYMTAYRLYVASLFKRADRAQVDELAKKAGRLGFSGYGMAGLSYYELGDKRSASAMLQKMKNLTRPSTRSIDVTETAESHRDRWDSDVGGLSLYLMLTEKLDPRSDMIQRIVTTLYDHQTAGYWYNTTDTNWALQALAQVIRAEEKEKAQYTGRMLLDGTALYAHDFQGVQSDRRIASWELLSPQLRNAPRDRIIPLRFEKQGPGTLFYAAELRYAIPSELAVARDEGLGVYSEIRTMDGASVDGQPLTVGQVYRMKAIVSTSKKRTFVAVRLPIPSGCEVLDANLSTSGTYGKRGGDDEYSDYGYSGYHREILDNEVQFFLDEVYGGQTEVNFLFRAVIPGIYPTPPVSAELMYEPEVFGRDIGRLITVVKAQGPAQ
ncbi:MAG TPA: Ig-like domain-containing protein [Spirochaetia bacterium]